MPKTIDNDIHFIDRSFGFESAYSAAVDVIRSARVEAMGARNGIGLVKLMGRHSGFVACQAALASADVDLVLIPEIEATLEGERGVLGNLDRVLARKGHAVVVVAEGAAQELMEDDAAASGTDKSGNAKLKDIGVFLRERITEHYQRAGREVTLEVHRSRATRFAACRPRRRTASTAGTWRATQCTPPWPATPRC